VWNQIFALTLYALLFAAVFPVSAQHTSKVWRIGYLAPISSERDATRREGFIQGLREHGYIVGQNIVIETRYADGNLDRQDALAAELVRLKVDVILAGGGTPTARAAMRATQTIPIVMTNVAEPVANGLIASLARPGGNLTGLTTITQELSGKRLELLKETFPKMTKVGVLFNSTIPERLTELKETQTAAQAYHVQIQPLKIQSPSDLDSAFEAATHARASAHHVFDPSSLRTSLHHCVRRQEPLLSMFAQRPVDAGA
jgi:putative ABC transport system substrate-binding protein